MITTGSLKFDSDNTIDDKSIKTLKKIIGERKVTVFASTREGEEKQIIESYINSTDNINSLLDHYSKTSLRGSMRYLSLQKQVVLRLKEDLQALECSEDTDILIGDSYG